MWRRNILRLYISFLNIHISAINNHIASRHVRRIVTSETNLTTVDLIFRISEKLYITAISTLASTKCFTASGPTSIWAEINPVTRTPYATSPDKFLRATDMARVFFRVAVSSSLVNLIVPFLTKSIFYLSIST